MKYLLYFQIVAAFMPKIKAGRSITVDTLCDFSEGDQMQKVLLLLFWWYTDVFQIWLR